MATVTESIAAGTATTPSAADEDTAVFDERLLRYRVSLSVLASMHKNGVLTDADYRKSCDILADKYGLDLCSIFRR